MRKVSLLVLIGLSSICALASAGWIVLAGYYLLVTGGTYGYVDGDTIVCGIPVFTADTWPQVSFVLFGIPAVILFIAVRLFRYGKERLAFNSLP
jgi:hypothetical protein